jgi:hypothetical protein
MPAGWLQGLLEAQAAALPSYPTASLVLLLRATARLKMRLPAASVAPLLVALQQQLRGMACRDVAEVVWSLGVLRVRPPQQFMAAAMAASARQLSGMRWHPVFPLHSQGLAIEVCGRCSSSSSDHGSSIGSKRFAAVRQALAAPLWGQVSSGYSTAVYPTLNPYAQQRRQDS